jgi:type IV pilus assembly protein PilP
MKLRHIGTMLMPAMLLAGCADGNVQELKQWMEDVKRQTKAVVPKLAEPKVFTPFAYERKSELDPFNPQKLSNALARLQPPKGVGIQPDLARRKEALESFPLDTIRMVGILQKPGQSHALLQVDKSVYQAKVGNHIGQNFGVITRISEAEVEIREIIKDPAGEWTERKAKLELQEAKK